jgi:hypothetical protein
MRKSIFLVVLLIIIGTAYAERPTLYWLEGNWEGTGGEVTVDFHWTIKLKYKADDKSIWLEYPSHSCGGYLKIITIETGKATTLEDVNYGLNSCNTGLKVLIDQESDGSITLTYFNPGESKPKAIAKLKRV